MASPLLTLVVMVKATSPSSTSSSTPVTVTVWAVSQFADVKTTSAGLTVPSDVSELVRVTVTVAVGWELRTTVKLAVPPASVVTKPDVGLTVTPALSLSLIVPVALAGVPTP